MTKAPRRHIIAPIPSAQISPEPRAPAFAIETPAQQLQIIPPSARMKKKSDLSMSAHERSFTEAHFFLALAAVVIIQTWFRRRRALFEIRRKTAWTIYQNIEYAGEQDQLKVRNITLIFFSLITCLPLVVQFLFGINASSD